MKTNNTIMILIFIWLFFYINFSIAGFINLPPGEDENSFGDVVDVSGDYIIIGSSKNTAYIFKCENGSWYYQSKLISKDSEHMGRSVSISENYALIGAKNSAYIFARNEEEWTQVAKLNPDNSNIDNHFGITVSISGKTATIVAGQGKPFSEINEVYIFEEIDRQWIKTQKITLSDISSNRGAIDVTGNYLIIGSSSEKTVYFYEKIEDNWVEKQRITEGNNFGYSVSISKTNAIVGTPNGYAIVYYRDGEKWKEQTRLGSNSEDAINFGRSVAIFKNKFALVGTPNESNGLYTNTGAVYLFTNSCNTWVLANKIKFSSMYIDFGYYVNISKNYYISNSRIRETRLNAIYVQSLKSFQKPIIISGTITDYTGKLVPDMSITFEGANNLNRQFDSYNIFSDEMGQYSQQVCFDWSGIVKFEKDCYRTTENFSNVKSEIPNVNITIPKKPIISGTITDHTGKPISDTSIIFEGGNNNGYGLWESYNIFSDEMGHYSQQVCFGWSGKIIFKKQDYSSTENFSNVKNNISDFNKTIRLNIISGYIKDILGNPLPGIEVLFNNNSGSAFTNSQGYYIHELFTNWSGSIIAKGRGYKFIPFIQHYSNISKDYYDQNFQGSKINISGFCLNSTNKPISDVTLSLNPNDDTYITDNSGFYSFDIDYLWNGKIYATKKDYLFEPEIIEYNNLKNSCGNQNFIGTFSKIRIAGTIVDNNGNTLSDVTIQIGENLD
ncbi:MAG: hypothetical protein OMM_01114 [Candidatus Magnetoglobus multicellularis str. Araruama]|uniref:PKD domain-containing protein n=1 Tax=Candidatus Magnetoglobus multicellularis str. Araruama TaxID=890399 RepID=A0A1V1PEC4_9BACT|nr:MAG: hypothetical protein OMM_01114 [Candidatus Magnetoglobus multicellularis str. Araruama]